MSTRPVRVGHYLAYGSNDVLGAGVMFVMSAWTLYFFTTFCGLTASEAGLAVRLVIAVGLATDPQHHFPNARRPRHMAG